MLLVEALHLGVHRPAGIPDEIWHDFESASEAFRAALTEEATRLDEEGDERQYYTVHEQLVRAANTALDKAIEQIQVYAPKFLQPPDPSELLALLPDERTALVAFCITDQGSIGFVTTAQDGQHIRAIEEPTFTRPALNRLFRTWEASYQRYRSERGSTALTAWQEVMARVLFQLSNDLLEPIFSALSSHIEHLVFLPSGELFLLPLHAAPLSSNHSDLVCDRYQVSYAPSVEVLAETQAKNREERAPELYAVIAPRTNPDLPFMLVEGKAIARLFSQQAIDSGQDGTKNRVITRVRGRTYVHFCCRGSYDWNNPLASGVELADGHLTLQELQRGEVDLSSARLVTLSACETGMIDILKGNAEEYVGVPAGFLIAGVPCVVSSLWAVPDLATALLMERFYSNHLIGEMTIVKALSEAQWWLRTVSAGELAQYTEQRYRQSHWSDKPQLFRLMRYYRQRAEHDPLWHPFAHPYYWAAFTVNGW